MEIQKFLLITLLTSNLKANNVTTEIVITSGNNSETNNVTEIVITNGSNLGANNVTSGRRIVGGCDVEDEHQYPFIVQFYPLFISQFTGRMLQVAIFYKGKGPYCGGSLITMKVVLTAAHCIITHRNCRRPAKKLSVRVGTSLCHTRQVRYCKKAIVHPDYIPKSCNHDIALIHMKKSFSMSDTCQRAVLPIMSHVYYNFVKDVVTCTLLGWGNVIPGQCVPSKVLKQVCVPTAGHEDCRKRWPYDLLPNQMCTLYNEGGKDACQGDSGGPVVCDNVLRGVVSKGIGCGRPGMPAIHTSVDYFEPWIINKTCEWEGLENEVCVARLRNISDPISGGYKPNNYYYKCVMMQMVYLFFKLNFLF